MSLADYRAAFSEALQALGGPPGTNGEQDRYMAKAHAKRIAPATAAQRFWDMVNA